MTMANVARALAADLWAVAAALGLIALGGLLGSALLSLAKAPRPAPTPAETRSRLERPLLCIGLGLGLLSYLPYLLGMAGLLTPNAVRLTLLICLMAVLGVRTFRRSGVQAPPEHLNTRTPEHPLWVWAVAGVGGIFWLGASLSCLTPMVDHDGLAYHVGAPKRWLELGALRYLPTHLHTQWPMGSEMLNALLLPVAGDAACKPLVALLTALTAVGVYVLGARLATHTVGLAAAGFFLLRTGVPSINTTSVEMALTLFVTLSAVALTGWAHSDDPRARRSAFLLAALFAGFACCVKLNGLLAAGFLTLAVLAIARPQPVAPGRRLPARGAQAGVGEAALFLGIAVLCASPWYIRTWINTGNPVYPFAYSIFGGRFWNAQASAVLSAYFHSFDLPGDTLAERHVVVVRHVWKLAILTLAGLAPPGPRWTRGFILAAGVFAMIQVWVSDIARFLLPAAPFAAIVIAWWIVGIAEGWPEIGQRLAPTLSRIRLPLSLRKRPLPPIRVSVVGWACAALLAFLYVPLGVRHAASSLPIALGYRSREAFVRRYVNNYDAFLWANRNLPADARVLYGPDNRTYFLQREVYWSSAVFQQQIVFDTAQAFADSLRRERIAYLILNRELYENHADAYETRMGWRADERRRLEEIAARSTILWAGNRVTIYRLPDQM